MTSVGDSDRNAQGLKRLRGRYVRRATYLITSVNDRAFIETVRTWVRAWDEANTDFRCGPLRGDLSSAPTPQVNPVRYPTLGLFAPAGLMEELHSLDIKDPGTSRRWGYLHDLVREWEQGLGEIARRFWSPRDYLLPFGELNHPSIAFVSACAFYDARDGDEDLGRFFPSFEIQPQSLPYEPDKFLMPSEVSRLYGELEYFRRVLFEHVGAEAVAEHERLADEAGWRQAGLDSQAGHGDWERRLWYLPIVAGMSVLDLRDAESRIIEASKLAGEDAFERRIRTLRAEGMSQRKIADLLGTSDKTVRAIDQGVAET